MPCYIGYFFSQTTRRAVTLYSAEETCAFSYSFDAKFIIAPDYRIALDIELAIFGDTNPRKCFDATLRSKRTTGNQLTVKIALSRHAYRVFKIASVRIVRGISSPPLQRSEYEDCKQGS